MAIIEGIPHFQTYPCQNRISATFFTPLSTNHSVAPPPSHQPGCKERLPAMRQPALPMRRSLDSGFTWQSEMTAQYNNYTYRLIYHWYIYLKWCSICLESLDSVPGNLWETDWRLCLHGPSALASGSKSPFSLGRKYIRKLRPLTCHFKWVLWVKQ